MRAPTIASAVWIKGKRPESFTDGKIHVIEFWATWCVPCNEAMPELSTLARKWAGRAEVDAIGVSELSHATDKSFDYMPFVRAFVKRRGDVMAFNVGEDRPDRKIYDSWLKASGTAYIPCAFVIDRNGRIAWIGSSFDLDFAMSAIAYLSDPQKAVERRIAALNADQTRSEAAAKAGDLQKILAIRRRDRQGVQTEKVYVLLRQRGLNLASSYAEKIRSEPAARIWDLLGIAWCIVDDGQYTAQQFHCTYRPLVEDYTLAARLAESAIKRCDYEDPSYDACLEDMEAAYEKSGRIVKAVEAEKAHIAFMKASRTEDYSSSIPEAEKKLAKLQGR